MRKRFRERQREALDPYVLRIIESMGREAEGMRAGDAGVDLYVARAKPQPGGADLGRFVRSSGSGCAA